MQLIRLLADVTQSQPGASQRSQHVTLATMLNQRHGLNSISVKGVAKWFERGSIPSLWLLRVAALPKKPINLATYA